MSNVSCNARTPQPAISWSRILPQGPRSMHMAECTVRLCISYCLCVTYAVELLVT
jgi:hypothetical protein